MAKSVREAPEEFFRALDELDAIPSSAKEEIAQRLNLTMIVPTAVERDGVRATAKLISEEIVKVEQGKNPAELAGKLVETVCEKTGPNPFLARVLAVSALGRMRAKNRFIIEPTSKLGRELILGMATEPTIRGSLILQGAHEGSVIRYGGQLPKREEKTVKQIETFMDVSQLEEFIDMEKRHAMMDEARDFFSKTNLDPNKMLLPEWHSSQGKMMFGPSDHPKGPTVPKYVMRLAALGLGKDGNDELRCHICSPEMQFVAAAWGMPVKDSYATGDLLDRNPTAVLTASRLALDEVKGESALKRTGLGIDALYVMEEEQIKDLEEDTRNSGLVFKAACRRVPADGLTFIAAARVLRRLKLDSPRVRSRVDGVIDSVVKELKQEVEVIHTRGRGGEVVSTEKTSILQSYLDQFNRTRGRLENRKASLEQAEESLKVAITAAICSVPGDDIPPVRPQQDLIRMMPEVVKRGISRDDLKLEVYHKFTLADSDRVCIETIYRVSTPQGAVPPVSIKRK